MYELVHAAGDTYYIECPAKIGLYRTDGGVYLIDSGNDKEAGKKVQKVLAAQGWTLKAVISTHANADHTGGNRLLQERLQAPVYAPGIDRCIAEYPILEPAFLYGGYPAKQLRNKFLLAPACEARPVSELELPPGMEILPLPGHFFDMIGVKTPDGVWFLSDCMSGENILEKYHAAFIYDVKGYLETLDRVSALSGCLFIPAHAQPQSDIRPLAELNRKKVLEIVDRLLSICREPIHFDLILKAFMDGYGLLLDFNQYVLVGSTLRSYLSYLMDEGRLEAEFVDNVLLYRSASPTKS